ncbi:MAG: site-specific integrase [Candidatus Bathyarchaeota archaeon]|nr:site-specific integrase [Candidatus Bathyarchaeota archaeon]
MEMRVDESEVVSKVLKDLAKSTQANYKATLKQLLTFVNSKEGLSQEISIEELVAEAKTDVKETQERIDQFFKWLQREDIEGYAPRVDKKGEPKTMRESSAHQRAYGFLIGFFANLDIPLERKWRRRIPKVKRVKQAIKKDKIYTFYDVDEKTRTIRFNRERMQQFLANLKLRDVAITLALLSSSQDSGDLFNLNVGDIREQENNRIFWEENREKTGVLFRTFISKEATRFIRRYIQQERRKAEDNAPLFVYRSEKRMTANNLASIYRDAARRMGIKWEKGEQNPLRPKRMRHLFRTACDTAGITELYTNAFMGHKNNQGQDYSEVSRAKLELEYLHVEPFLTVYGEVEESLEIREDVQRLRSDLDSMMRNFTRNVELVARDVFHKWMREQLEADREAMRDMQKWREEFTRSQGKGT